MIRLECDYAEGAHERVLRRLFETNLEQTPGYGEDLYCARAREYIQQLCQRVVILHKGRLIREADMAELTGEDGVIRLRAAIAMKEKQLLPALKGLPCVRRVKVLPTMDVNITQVELECAPGGDRGDPQTQLFRLLCALDAPLRMLMPVKDTLEEVFLRATAEG